MKNITEILNDFNKKFGTLNDNSFNDIYIFIRQQITELIDSCPDKELENEDRWNIPNALIKDWKLKSKK